ncbi:MAG TPA: hypothetical protein VG345_16670 [Bryobacteraceae bacterium]|jgi:hypothetical protein|nr:hypothetical protein [Bryobacteraceae bacterium]
MYQRASTNNPLGFRPWNFATGRSGLAFYAAQKFPVPLNDGTPGLTFYGSQQFPVPMNDGTPGLGQGEADQAYTPASGFQQDASTLPPAPAGYTYTLSPDGITSILVPLPPPPPNYTPYILLGAAGLAAYWWYTHQKKSRVMALPVAAIPTLKAA